MPTLMSKVTSCGTPLCSGNMENKCFNVERLHLSPNQNILIIANFGPGWKWLLFFDLSGNFYIILNLESCLSILQILYLPPPITNLWASEGFTYTFLIPANQWSKFYRWPMSKLQSGLPVGIIYGNIFSCNPPCSG